MVLLGKKETEGRALRCQYQALDVIANLQTFENVKQATGLSTEHPTYPIRGHYETRRNTKTKLKGRREGNQI